MILLTDVAVKDSLKKKGKKKCYFIHVVDFLFES